MNSEQNLIYSISVNCMEVVITDKPAKPVSGRSLRGVYRSLRSMLFFRWRMFWLGRSGHRGLGRVAAWLASRHSLPYHQMSYLAEHSPRGFVSSRARVSHADFRFGSHVYLGDGVIVYSTSGGGLVELGDRVHLYGNTFVETGMGGRIRIEEGTHIQPGCHIHAYLSEVRIGKKVEIAPGCGFYCYDHGMSHGIPIMDQPLTSKGGIRVGDGAWLGYGVTVLQGVTIGEGAVVAAGSVVAHDIPENAIAAGIPAKVLKYRDGTSSADR